MRRAGGKPRPANTRERRATMTVTCVRVLVEVGRKRARTLSGFHALTMDKKVGIHSSNSAWVRFR
jgi:hypothetical protein